MHGTGVYIDPRGNRYEGDYRNAKKHGMGAYYNINGDVYRGQFKNSEGHGQGTMTFANGGTYVGQYVRGREHGKGKLTQPGYLFGKYIFEGEFKRGIPQDFEQMNALNEYVLESNKNKKKRQKEKTGQSARDNDAKKEGVGLGEWAPSLVINPDPNTCFVSFTPCPGTLGTLGTELPQTSLS
jgi:hypothetical protein